jgi:diketogulonate reductase-like aldo/keto reductase
MAERVEIAENVFMPRLGLGTSHVVGAEEVERQLRSALALGYRHIDTAAGYHNESEIGQALDVLGVPREELFVTSKLWPWDQGYQQALRGCEQSLRRLGLDYLDLYLIHWPERAHTAETWRAFEQLLAEGKVRSIGVSNFTVADLKQLAETARTPPAVNQVEFHPYLQRPELVSYCEAHGIVVEAWSPLMRGRIESIPELTEIGRAYGKTSAQVTLRWILQRGLVTIPKSTHEERLRENADIFDFDLSAQDVARIDALDRGRAES